MTAQDRAARNLVIQSLEPLNAEPAPAVLIDAFVTPTQAFYVRNHGAIPALSADHAVAVGGLVASAGDWTRDALERRFPAHTVLAVLQCAGNRRADLQQVGETSGNPWGVGAIGNAEWTGVRLADLLEACEIDRVRARHVRFLCADEADVDGGLDCYGVSIPLAKALHPDTLIAWAMNGEPLPPEHGFPLRLIVPGYAGVRSAKWLTRVEVSETPATQPIQAKDYHIFPALVRREEADWATGLLINAMPINAAICAASDRAPVDRGPVSLSGYAVAGERRVARVDVSTNGGRDWLQATLEQRADAPWSWTRWRWDAELGPGEHEIVVRAVDETGQMQTSQPEDCWNFAGYLATHWHRLRVRVS